MRKAVLVIVLVIVALSAGAALRYSVAPQQPPFSLALRIGEGHQRNVQGAVPILFTVFLSRAPGRDKRDDVHFGGGSDPWYGHLVIEPVDSQRTPALHWLLLGRPRSIYMRHDARENRTTLEVYDGATAVFDEARSIYTAEFGVPPEQVAQIPVGRHAYRAVLVSETRLPWRWHGRLASEPIWVTVEPASAAQAARSESARLAQAARFYLQVNRFDEALRAAQSLVRVLPENPGYHTMLGDALNGLRRDEDAISEYREALRLVSREQHHGHHDAPEYLFMRMTQVQDRAKAGAGAHK